MRASILIAVAVTFVALACPACTRNSSPEPVASTSDGGADAMADARADVYPDDLPESIPSYPGATKVIAKKTLGPRSVPTWDVSFSTSDEPARFATANREQPHARINGGLRGAGDQEVLDERDELGRNGAPAGGLAVSANDMARWLQIQLNHGAMPEGTGRLFSEAAHIQMWQPMVLQPISEVPERLKATQPMFNTYALGWDVADYRGAKIVWHGGAVFGFLTAVVLLPEKQVGFAIEINSEDGEIIRGLMYELLDHYLGLPRTDWVARFRAVKQQRVSEGLKALKEQTAKPAAVGPSLPEGQYAGTFADPWYGNIEVAVVDGKLRIDFRSTPRMGGALEHWQYDTFVTRFDDRTIEPAYVTFSLDADGKIDRVTMKPVSPLADFSYDFQDLLFRPVKTNE